MERPIQRSPKDQSSPSLLCCIFSLTGALRELSRQTLTRAPYVLSSLGSELSPQSWGSLRRLSLLRSVPSPLMHAGSSVWPSQGEAGSPSLSPPAELAALWPSFMIGISSLSASFGRLAFAIGRLARPRCSLPVALMALKSSHGTLTGSCYQRRRPLSSLLSLGLPLRLASPLCLIGSLASLIALPTITVRLLSPGCRVPAPLAST